MNLYENVNTSLSSPSDYLDFDSLDSDGMYDKEDPFETSYSYSDSSSNPYKSLEDISNNIIDNHKEATDGTDSIIESLLGGNSGGYTSNDESYDLPHINSIVDDLFPAGNYEDGDDYASIGDIISNPSSYIDSFVIIPEYENLDFLNPEQGSTMSLPTDDYSDLYDVDSSLDYIEALNKTVGYLPKTSATDRHSDGVNRSFADIRNPELNELNPHLGDLDLNRIAKHLKGRGNQKIDTHLMPKEPDVLSESEGYPVLSKNLLPNAEYITVSTVEACPKYATYSASIENPGETAILYAYKDNQRFPIMHFDRKLASPDVAAVFKDQAHLNRVIHETTASRKDYIAKVKDFKNLGATAYEFMVPVSKKIMDTINKQVKEVTASQKADENKINSKWEQCYGIAWLEATKRFNPNIQNHLRDSLVAKLETDGMADAARYVDNVFEHNGEKMMRDIQDRAKHLINLPESTRNEAAKTAVEARYFHDSYGSGESNNLKRNDEAVAKLVQGADPVNTYTHKANTVSPSSNPWATFSSNSSLNNPSPFALKPKTKGEGDAFELFNKYF